MKQSYVMVLLLYKILKEEKKIRKKRESQPRPVSVSKLIRSAFLGVDIKIDCFLMLESVTNTSGSELTWIHISGA